MSFKNAFKIFFTRFGLIWSLLLYIVIFAAIITGLSLPFILPIIEILQVEGIVEQLNLAINQTFSGIGLNGIIELWADFFNNIFNLFILNPKFARTSVLFIVIVLVIAFRFFIGLYEIPLSVVLDGWLGAKAHYGFFGKFISKMGLSVRFVFAKMLYTIIFDVISALIFYGLFSIMTLNILIPFLTILIFVIFYSLRFSLISMWASSIVSNNMSITKAFFHSLKMTFKNFKSVYSCFIFAWLLLIALNIMFGIFTFGVALIMTIPISIVFVSILNMTIHYTKHGKRFYADNTIITPPISRQGLNEEVL